MLPMFLGAPSALSGETVKHGDTCPLDAPPLALTVWETDLRGNVSIVLSTFVHCISGYVVPLVALPKSFALGAVSKIFGFWGLCRTTVLLLSFGSALSLSISMLWRCPICFQFLLAALSCCCFCSRVALLHPQFRILHSSRSSRVLHVLRCIFFRLDQRSEVSSEKGSFLVLFGTWLDGFPFPGPWMWLSCSSVFHDLPAGRKLYSSRMRSVIQALRTCDLWVLQLAWNTWRSRRACKSVHHAAVRHRSGFHCCVHAMVPVVCFRNGSGHVQGPVASSLAVCWGDILHVLGLRIVVQGCGGRQARGPSVAW